MNHPGPQFDFPIQLSINQSFHSSDYTIYEISSHLADYNCYLLKNHLQKQRPLINPFSLSPSFSFNHTLHTCRVGINSQSIILIYFLSLYPTTTVAARTTTLGCQDLSKIWGTPRDDERPLKTTVWVAGAVGHDHS